MKRALVTAAIALAGVLGGFAAGAELTASSSSTPAPTGYIGTPASSLCPYGPCLVAP